MASPIARQFPYLFMETQTACMYIYLWDKQYVTYHMKICPQILHFNPLLEDKNFVLSKLRAFADAILFWLKWCNFSLTLSQTINFRPIQTERVSRQQFQI